MNKNDGGPAFPQEIKCGHGSDTWTEHAEGMSLRDYFAAVVIGHLVCAEMRQEMTTPDDAEYAYMVADAMLAERAK